MFRRPSSRRKSTREPISINLVPLMDATVTLIAFLMFTMSFIEIVHTESPAPIVEPASPSQQSDAKPLQLTLSIEPAAMTLWSPFGLTEAYLIPNLSDGHRDTGALRTAVARIKGQFPSEDKIVLAPHGDTPYDELVAIMDAVRLPETKGSAPLFPQILFGNILGDAR